MKHAGADDESSGRSPAEYEHHAIQAHLHVLSGNVRLKKPHNRISSFLTLFWHVKVDFTHTWYVEDAFD